MADETSDIAGKEQLSIGVRFFDEKRMIVREECLGFVELTALDAKSVSDAIDQFIQSHGLDPMKCIGQGYDGCNTMSGPYGAVQKYMRETYTKALFFHCASHKTNLVVNDSNCVPEIRNTISTVKNVINFFKESVLRRRYVPNIPAFCETRWSQKYNSISIFKTHYETIVAGLKTLSKEGNSNTRSEAFQLHKAATSTVFIICVFIISKYSALIEPIVNALQAKSFDLFSCSNHIKRITNVLSENRSKVDEITQSIIDEADNFAEKINVELVLPNITNETMRQLKAQGLPVIQWNIGTFLLSIVYMIG